MGWKDILEEWRRDLIPVEERLTKVLGVVENVFLKKWEWKSGTHIKVTDDRLLFYKKKIRSQDDKVAQDGSFQIIVKNKLVVFTERESIELDLPGYFDPLKSFATTRGYWSMFVIPINDKSSIHLVDLILESPRKVIQILASLETLYKDG